MEQNGYIAALSSHIIRDGSLANKLRYDQVRGYGQLEGWNSGILESWVLG